MLRAPRSRTFFDLCSAISHLLHSHSAPSLSISQSHSLSHTKGSLFKLLPLFSFSLSFALDLWFMLGLSIYVLLLASLCHCLCLECSVSATQNRGFDDLLALSMSRFQSLTLCHILSSSIFFQLYLLLSLSVLSSQSHFQPFSLNLTLCDPSLSFSIFSFKNMRVFRERACTVMNQCAWECAGGFVASDHYYCQSRWECPSSLWINNPSSGIEIRDSTNSIVPASVPSSSNSPNIQSITNLPRSQPPEIEHSQAPLFSIFETITPHHRPILEHPSHSCVTPITLSFLPHSHVHNHLIYTPTYLKLARRHNEKRVSLAAQNGSMMTWRYFCHVIYWRVSF